MAQTHATRPHLVPPHPETAPGPSEPEFLRRAFETRLLAEGLTNGRDLEAAFTHASQEGSSLVDALAILGFVSEADGYAQLAQAAGVPLVDLSAAPISELAVRLVPERVARQHVVLPLGEDGRTLTYAGPCPFDGEANRDLAFASGRRTRLVLAPRSQILDALERAYPKMGSLERLLSRLRSETLLVQIDAPRDAQVDESPVVKICDYVLAAAVRARASDVHVEPLADGARIRYRVHGILETILTIPADAVPQVLNRFKVLARADISVHHRPQDGAFRVKVEDHTVDVRLSVLPTVGGEKMVMRIIDSSSTAAVLDELGYTAPALERLKRALARPDGLVLFTGPTGCGKTTSLYAALNHLRTGHTNVTSVEDPVERLVEGVNQIPVDARAGNSFSAVLRSVLRQDPNVLMVGEIRDAEVAQIVGQAAYTGHLVLSSVHTSDAASAVTRLLNLGLEPFKIAESLTAIVAQRLVRRLCPDCRHLLPDEEGRSLGARHGIERVAAEAGPGCPRCRQTGYLDRLAVGEVLSPDEAMRDAILRGATASVLRRTMQASGGQTMRDAALDLVAHGVTSLEEINRVLADEDDPRENRHNTQSTVLIVDDDRMIRMLVRLLLEKQGYRVLEGENGQHAVELAGREHPDLLIVDLMMPEVDGYQAIDQIRREPSLAMLPVMVLTAENGPGAEQRVLELGADDYMTKPFDPDILLARVQAFFRRLQRTAA